jgi:hypothetical protein
MNIYNKIEDIHHKNTFFTKPTINKLTCYKLFYKIAYNIDSFVLNTLLIEINVSNITIIKEQHNYKCVINIDNAFLLKLKEYETHVLSNMNIIINKAPVISSQKYLSNNTLIYNYKYNPENIKLYIRISGIWESDTQYGLITKIYHYPSTVKF